MEEKQEQQQQPKQTAGQNKAPRGNNQRRKPSGQKPNNKGPKQNGGRNGKPRRANTGPVDKMLRENVERNNKIHRDRLNPHYKLDLNSKAKIRITPLGGLDEIGGNICVIETEEEAIIIDVGMSFPSEDMHGVDILVPDYTYLKQIKSKITAFIITHAHEDHIGSVPYIFRDIQAPLYGTTFPLALISNKFDEHGLKQHKKYFRPVEKRKLIKVGKDFEVEWIHTTHSIIDSSALAIKTPAGTLIHTGDFKIDHTPVDGFPTDLQRLAYYGEKGVLCLLSDSTNSYNPSITPSELTVGPALRRIFQNAKGRVILSTFSSNIHRLYQAIQIGLEYNRKICIIGRSMERNLETALNYEYIKFPRDIFVDPYEVSKMNDKDVLILTTGSQGEPSSALFRMSTHEHRHIKIKPSDLIILSARAIPGNEGSISTMLNNLQKAGASVAHEDRDIHVSGHAAQEEQKLMIRLTQPKFFLPVHGEYNHVAKHKTTGIACGIPEKNVYLMNDGEQIEITAKYIKKAKSVKTGKLYIDNQNNHQIEDDIVIDRQKLATEGVVMIMAQVCKEEEKLRARPKVTSFGLVADKQDKAFAKEMEGILEQFLVNLKPGLLDNHRALENDLRQVVRKHIYRKMKKYPLIVPTVVVL